MDIHDINIRNTFIKIQAEQDRNSLVDPDEIYENASGSKWIVAVDDDGNVFVLLRPNIHPNFFECGGSAEEIGLPYETDITPGVYEWICSLNETKDWESGYVDGWTFDVEEEKLLWTWVENGEADKAGNEEA